MRFLKTIVLAVIGLGFAALSAMASQPEAWEIGYQPSASPIMDSINHLTLILNVIIISIVVVITGLIAYCVWRYNERRNPVPAHWAHNTWLEVGWTAIPILLLLIIAIPSFRLLYFMDKAEDPELTLKITGKQWFWTYEYPDHGVTFDALMLQDTELQPGQPRLLATDNEVVLPVETKIRLLFTGADVIHSWAIPAFGVKTDTVPGRINESWVLIDTPGTYYGQCSELCGVNHAFMPIQIRAVPKDEFEPWLEEARAKFATNSFEKTSGDDARLAAAKP